MKENYSHINFILDKSGSMGLIKNDTIGGFNTFIEEQKRVDGKCTFSLTEFNNLVTLASSFVDIQHIDNLDDRTFIPSGCTALYDAIGTAITLCGDKLLSMKEEDRPSKVLVVILTDGEENSSKEFSHSKINEMIQHQTDKYKWEFIFLGANIDAERVGSSLGIKLGNTMTFSADEVHTNYTFKTMSCKLGDIRNMSTEAYSVYNATPTAGAFSSTDKLGAVN